MPPLSVQRIRSGRYWFVGDIQNTPGRRLCVRLSGPDYGPGAADKWTDASTGEYGDLLDLIARNRDLRRAIPPNAPVQAGASRAKTAIAVVRARSCPAFAG